MEKKNFDLAVIGAGPGGYVAAIKAAQNGKKVCLIDKQRENLGGSCLNVGCIPTKTLLAGAQVLHKVKQAESYGIQTGPVSFVYQKMKERKDVVVQKIRKSLEGLLLANQMTLLFGQAEFLSPNELKVMGQDNCLVGAENIIIATGSEPLNMSAFPFDHKKVLSSSSILELTTLPRNLAIIGGGYIGCEFASLFAELGVRVTILEALSSIVLTQGKEVGDVLTRAFKQKGIDVQTDVFVEGIDTTADGVSIRIRGKTPVTSDLALVSVGRKIVSANLGLEKAGVKVDAKGAVLVNEKMQTNVPGIYAIGDVTGQVQLAHVASHQGIVAAMNILGRESTMHYNAVPAVIFTSPEIAMVGMTLEQAQQAGFTNATVGKFPFQALGKSIAAIETEGFAQVVTDKKTGQILGAQVVGYDASALISELTLAITSELTIDNVSETIHAHPTTPESWMEAALLAQEMPLHLPPRVKR